MTVPFSKKEVFKLIELYREREELWNTTCESYKRIDLKQIAWGEIADHFNVTIDVAKAKIRNLRTTFLSVKRKKQNFEESSNASDEFDSCLFYYDELTFLEDHMTSRNSTAANRSYNSIRFTPAHKPKVFNKRNVIKLIGLYNEREALWNTNSSLYRRIDLKKRAWAEMANYFDVSVDDVKYKIKNLRSCFAVELRKKRAFEESEGPDEYQPNLFYFNELSFLAGKKNNNKKQDIIEYSTEENSCEMQNNNPLDDNDDDNSKSSIEDEASSSPIPNQSDNSYSSKSKIKINTKKEDDAVFEIIPHRNVSESDHIDECLAFGKSIALQLKKLPDDELNEAMCEIQNLTSKHIKKYTSRNRFV